MVSRIGAGCGIEESTTVDGTDQLGLVWLKCKCEIEFNYCTQTSTGIGSEDKIERSLGERTLEKLK